MNRSALFDGYEALKELLDQFRNGASLNRPHPEGGFVDANKDDLRGVIKQLESLAGFLRASLSGRDAPPSDPEELASALLRLDLPAEQREAVLETLETFLRFEREACARVLDQEAAEWSREFQVENYETFAESLEKLATSIRARGRVKQ